MEIKEKILQFAKEQKTFKTSTLVSFFKEEYSRQYLSRVISELVAANKLLKSGVTRQATYALSENAYLLGQFIKKRIANKEIAEDEILDSLKLTNPFLDSIAVEKQSKFDYAFLEMLNNAIEHSGSQSIEIEVLEKGWELMFSITDF